MIFHRSVPAYEYADYDEYRPLLREDFQHRCAYCLRHENDFGGEAGTRIDHFAPKEKFPKGERKYKNLYLTCDECNTNKGQTWPSVSRANKDRRFLNPCREDHDDHFVFSPNGTITAKTDTGEYTDEMLLLWRPSLVHWRGQIIKDQVLVTQLQQQLNRLRKTRASAVDLQVVQDALNRLKAEIDPPIFDRPRKNAIGKKLKAQVDALKASNSKPPVI